MSVSQNGLWLRTSPEAFAKDWNTHSVVPVVAEMLSDWWTPVRAFHSLLGDSPHGFLLESVEGGERLGRYSFLGRDPFLILRARDNRVWCEGPLADQIELPEGEPLQVLKHVFDRFSVPDHAGLPPFVGGAVGYFGYETIRWVEAIPQNKDEAPHEDDMTLLFFRDIVAFDHVRRRLYLISNAVGEGDPEVKFSEAKEHVEGMVHALRAPSAPPETPAVHADTSTPDSNHSPEEFMEAVRQSKEWILSGDIFQVVLSQRLSLKTKASDLDLYRSLRAVNPSPYMFLLRLEDWSAVGSSPEPLVRVTNNRLTYRPIAGTAPRSGDREEDARRAEALKADPKEQAEHVMLVDLGRNDLGRCAKPGSVAVEELMVVERYSHVMHLVSGLTGELDPTKHALDALFACFPAGTVSGAPKVRAMEIIEELEPDRRGLYAGAVGYLDFSGNLDTCIALRTMKLHAGTVYVQAGAGIVADSDPKKEYEETLHKARALLDAVQLVGRVPGAPE